MQDPYTCPECDGERTIDCSECGNEYDCPHCSGSGLDPEKVDVEAFLAECRKQGCMSVGLYGGGRYLGQRFWEGSDAQHDVLVADYLVEENG